ncbi:MAG: tandem-95 repeat protein [Dongiaceae bacterium]
MTPDGTLIAEIEQTPARSEDEGRIQYHLNDNPQIAALPEAMTPVLVGAPAAGERIEVDLDAVPEIRLAVSLAGAQVEVSGGKIIVTLADGGVIVLEGEVVQQFLAGGDAGIEDFLASAAGRDAVAEMSSPTWADDQNGSGFRPSGVVAAEFMTSFDAAGALAGTELGYGSPHRGGVMRDGGEVVGTTTPRNNPPMADPDTTLDVAEDSGNTSLSINPPVDADGDALSITVTDVPDAAIGTVYLADGTTPAISGMTLTPTELSGLVFRPAADANGAAGSFSYTVDDGHGGGDSQTVTLNVTPINDMPAAAADAVTADEDTALTIPVATLLGNDTDVDGDALTITSVQGAMNGTVQLIGGNVVFTPAADYSGPASFTYTASDGNGGTSIATVNVTVNPVNDAPVANADAASTNEDTALTIPVATLLGNDTDVDGDTLTIASVQAAVNGTAQLVGGNVLFTPVADYNGPASFTYTVSDGNGGTSIATVNVTVNPVNDAPVVNADAVSTNEDTALTIPVATLLGNDTDVDGDTLTITSVQGAVNGTVQLVGGNVLFTPAADYTGPASFTYTASDGNGGTSTATVNVTVNPVNDAPVAAADAVSTNEDTALTIPVATLLGNDTDVDGDTLTITSVQGAVNGMVQLVGGNVLFTPAADYSGPASFTYTVSDGNGGTSTATVNVTVSPVNDAPVANADAVSTNEDTALTIPVAALLGNDTDVDGDSLTIASVQGAVNGTVQLIGGNVVFTPAPDYNGPASFTYTVSDGNGGTSTATVDVTVSPVNDAPVANADAVSTAEDTALTIPVTTLLGNDTDVDGDALSIVSVQGAVNGTVQLIGGNVLFTPAADYSGPASFTYTVSDGNGGTSTAMVNVTVNPVNDAPVANADAVSTNEDTALTIPVATLLGNDTDVDGDALTITSVQGAVNGTVQLVGGNVLFSPAADYDGPASFTYTVSDGNGGTSTATVSVTVNPVNDAPVANADTVSTNEDTALTIPVATLEANDGDVDGDTLTITSVQGAVNGTVQLVGGNVVFTPATDYSGPASFTYTVSDGNGGSSTATVNVTVNPVNDAPVANADAVSTAEDTALTIPVATLLGNDTDVDGDSLTIASVQGAVNGTVQLVGGNVVFTPAVDYAGLASFTYTVSDGNGGSSTATVNIIVNPVNDAPVAAADVVATNEDTALAIPVATLLGNDTDVDGDSLTIASVQGAVNGTVQLVGGNVVFTPTADYSGPASFTYTVSDGNGGSSTATVNVTVNPVNDAPVAAADAVSTAEDTALTIPVATLLGNDTDVDGDSLTITSVQGAVNGTVQLIGGNVVFTPAADYNGPASFTYTVSDGNGGSSTATVNVTVNPVNDAPVAAADAVSTAEDTALTIPLATLLGNDTDVDGDNLTIASVQGAVNGTVQLIGGNVVFTPAADYNGPASFTYTVSDGNGGSSTATVNVTVNPVNDAPVAAADAVSTNEDVALTIPVATLLGNDTDVDGDSLTIASVQGAVNGTVQLVGSNVLFTPAADYAGPASFTYTISDGNGGASTTTVNVTVNPVNDAPVANVDAVSTNEDTALAIPVATLLGNDTDVDGDTLSIVSVQDAVNGTVQLVGGNVLFTPAADYAGPASFTYTVSDGNGGTSTATVGVTVNPVNDAPVANTDAVSTNEDTALTIPVATLEANDGDVDGDILTITSVQGAVNGTVQLVGGNVVFTPVADYNGPASFTYTVSDGNGGTSTATVNVTVNPINDAPVANADAVSTNEDTALTIPAATLLGNDTDVDGDALTITSVQGAINGMVQLVGGNVVFTPAADYSGPASFTYTASDGNGGTSIATVNVTVNPVNDAPVANVDAVSTNEDTALTIPVATLLDNDTDVDGDVLTITSVQGAVNGTVQLVGGNVLFTPAADYNGPASFTYTMSDGNSGTSTAIVNVTVSPVNDAPVAAADAVSTSEDTALIIPVASLLGNDTDVDGDTLTITSVQGAVNGAVQLVGGNVVFTPAGDYSGPASFTYTVSDGNGGSSTATVNVTVNPVNDAPVANADAVSTNEDTALTIPAATLLSNDTDVDGDALTITSVQGAVNGTVQLVGGNVVFTPATDYSGPASFTYTVSDGNGGSSTATVNVTVNPVNDAPVAAADVVATNEDTALAIPVATLLGNDTDVDGDSLTIASVQGAVNGTVQLVGGNVVFTPAADYNGPASFTYTVSDGNGGTSTATVNVTVNPVNDAPVAAADAVSTAEDTALTIPVAALLGNDTDVDGDTLTITSVQGVVNGTVQLVGGNVLFTPAADYAGPASFTYTVSDGNGGTSTATVGVTVNPVNDAPVAAADAVSTNEDTALTIPVATLVGNDTDVDGDALTITSVQGAINGTVQLVGGNVVFTPAADYSGPASFTYTASDGNGGTSIATVNVTVNPVNDAPVAAADAVSTNEDTALTIPVATLLDNDTDVDGDALTITSVQGAVNGTVQLVGGNVVFTPAADYAGPASFTYTVSDGSGGASTTTVNVTVNPINDAPVANADAVSTNEDVVLTIPVATLLGNDTDVDGDTLTITSVQGAVNGTVQLVGGNVLFTPAADYSGPASFTYTVSDGNGGTSIATVNVTVNPVNDAPVANADIVSTNEDTALTIPVATLLGNDTDVDGDTLTITSVQGAVNGTVQLIGGNVMFTPAGDYAGPASFTYTVSDGNGGSSTATVNVTVNPVNDAPVANTDAVSTNEDTALTIPVATLLGNDTDVDGDTLTITSVQDAVNGTVQLVGGNVVFSPAADYNGPASFTYTISDGNGGTSTAAVDVTINPVNDAPVANADTVSTNEDTALTIPVATLVGNDTDVDGDALTITSVQGAINGTVQLVGGNVLFTPAADYNGPASFTYTISDGNGGTSTATVNVTVNPVNDAPVAAADAVSTNEDTALTIPVATLLGNDTDVDGDMLSITSVQGAVNGTVQLVGGSVLFTPAADYSGPASFTYTVSDGNGGTSIATVNVTVNPVNDAPVANADAVSTNEDTALTIPAVTLLGNDTDIDGDSLTITSVQGAVNGTVSLVGGNVLFTPAADYSGPASFTYTVSDGNGGTSTATVNVTVNPVNDAPVANADAVSTNEDTALTIPVATLLGNDTDVDGDTLTITSVQGAVNGTVQLVGGNVVFTPAADYAGPASFTYTVLDGNGGTSIATVNVTVNPVNDAPVANADAVSTNEDTTLTIPAATLLGNDTDMDGDTLSIVSVQSAVNGTVQLVGGNVVFTPAADYSGPASFTYTVSDGNGGTSTATVNVTVNPVNDAPQIVVAVADDGAADSAAFTLDVSGNFADVDGDVLAYSATGLPTGLSIDPVTGVISGTLHHSASQGGPGSNGIYLVTVTAADGNGGTTSDTFNLNVTNPAPVLVAQADPVVYVDQNGNGSYDAGEGSPTIVNGSMNSGDGSGNTTHTRNFEIPAGVDPADTTIHIVLATLDNSIGIAVNGQDLFNPGILEFETGGAYTPATDSFARFLDGAAISAHWEPNVNGLPRIVIDITENGIFIYGTRDVNSTALEPMQLTAGSINLPNLVNGQNAVVIVNDDDVGIDGIDGIVTIQTGATRDRAFLEGDSVSINAAPAFSDPDGDTLTYSAAGLPTGLSINAATGLISGSLSATAATGGPGGGNVYTVTVTASDGEGGAVSANFTITAIEIDNSPIVENESWAVSTGTSIAVDAGTLLENDSDPEGGTLGVTGVSGAAGGSVNLSGSTVTYTANGTAGAGSFAYTVADAGGAAATGTVSVTKLQVSSGANAIDISALGVSRSLIDAGSGNDTVIGGSGRDTLIGGNGSDQLFGGAGDDSLGGGSSNDTLNGGDGNDTLDGGSGNDSMIGGAGDDLYIVNSASDVIVENVNEGLDTVQGSVSYTLANNVENLILTGSSNISGTGNALDNVIVGNSGNNTLTGGSGNDTLDGGAGTDNLSGGDGDDSLIGGSSNDTLNGGNGNDTLDGGSGNDGMTGGAGDDVYIVDSSSDVVVESANQGSDTVYSSVTYTLANNVETLILTGSGNIGGTGNSLANLIVGNSGNNSLSGGGGTDTIIGGAGNDTINANNGDIRIAYLAMADVLDTAANGTDTINNFDANASGGQDVIDLTALFDSLGPAFDTSAERQAAVQWSFSSGSSTTATLQLNLDGAAGFEYTLATVNLVSSTASNLDKSADIVLGGV